MSGCFSDMLSLSKSTVFIAPRSVNIILKIWSGSDTLTYIINKTCVLAVDCFPTVSLESTVRAERQTYVFISPRPDFVLYTGKVFSHPSSSTTLALHPVRHGFDNFPILG